METRTACDCLDLAFTEIHEYKNCEGCSLAQAMHHFGIGERCAGCVADAIMAMDGTLEDMHEFLLFTLPPE